MARPPKYSTEAELIRTAKEYFNECIDKNMMPQKAGLCLHLDISRETYSQYREKFPDAIKTFDFLIESAWVQRLAGNAPTGAIFYLKNAFKEEYKDRIETDHTTKGKELPAPIIPINAVLPNHSDTKDSEPHEED